MSSLKHITLTTGHTNESARSEIDDAVLEHFRPFVDQGYVALVGSRFQLIERQAANAIFDVGHDNIGMPIARCWLGWSDPAAMKERVLNEVPAGERQADVPADAPFLAVRLDPAALMNVRPDDPQATQALNEIGDAERCAAWAIVALASDTAKAS